MIEAPHVKDPECIARGQAGAERRWGAPRQINLRDLSDAERRIVLASIAAIRAEKARDDAAQAQTV
jgi:hypothetical protein